MSAPLTYTVEEVAELLGVSRGSAYQAAREGQLPTLRLGRRLLVPRQALEQMLTAAGTDSPQTNGAAGTAPQEKEVWKVAPFEGFVGRPHDLHVLLRHRPRSIRR